MARKSTEQLVDLESGMSSRTPSYLDLPDACSDAAHRVTYENCPHECPECVETVRMTIDSVNGNVIAEKIAQLYMLGSKPIINVHNHYTGTIMIKNPEDLEALGQMGVPQVAGLTPHGGPSIVSDSVQRSLSLNDLRSLPDIRVTSGGRPRPRSVQHPEMASSEQPQSIGLASLVNPEKTTIEFTKRLRPSGQCPSMKSSSKPTVLRGLCGNYLAVVRFSITVLSLSATIALLYVLTANIWSRPSSGALEAPPF